MKKFTTFVAGLLYASSLCLMSVSTYAGDTEISGSGKIGIGSTDVDVTYWVNNALDNPKSNFKSGSTVVSTTDAHGNITGTQSNTGTGTASNNGDGFNATVNIPLAITSQGGTASWSITLTGGSDYKRISWYWTVDGRQVPNSGGQLPDVNANGNNKQASLTISLPYGAASIAVANFALYGDQDPSIGNDPVAFADFSTSPFAGSSVPGIPPAFTLDGSNPSVTLSAQDYPGLATQAGNQIGWSADFNGTSYRGLLTPLPEPSTFALLGIGAFSLLAYERRRRTAKVSIRIGVTSGH